MMSALRECSRPDSVQASIGVVEKAFTILEGWNHRGESLGVSELSRRTGLPKSTSHRLLAMLAAAGVVERLAGTYRLGERIRGISGVLATGFHAHLREICLPYLQDMYELTHETIHLGVLDGVDVHCVDKIYGHRRVPVASRIGGLLPAHCTALGKALLAFSPIATQRQVLTSPLAARTPATLTQPLRLAAELRAIRGSGLAYDRRELHPDVICVAAPITDHRGRAIASISISGPASRFQAAAAGERLRRAARAASVAVDSLRMAA